MFFLKIFIDLLNGDLTKKGFKLKRNFNFFFFFALTCNFNIKINVYMAFRATLVLNNRYINFLVVYVLGA